MRGLFGLGFILMIWNNLHCVSRGTPLVMVPWIPSIEIFLLFLHSQSWLHLVYFSELLFYSLWYLANIYNTLANPFIQRRAVLSLIKIWAPPMSTSIIRIMLGSSIWTSIKPWFGARKDHHSWISTKFLWSLIFSRPCNRVPYSGTVNPFDAPALGQKSLNLASKT